MNIPQIIIDKMPNDVLRIKSLTTVKDGWNFGQGKDFQIGSLYTLESFLQAGFTFPPKEPSIFLSDAGNLNFVWFEKKRSIEFELEFFTDKIEFYIFYANTDYYERHYSLEHISDLIKLINDLST